jgi:hypothetical protein
MAMVRASETVCSPALAVPLALAQGGLKGRKFGGFKLQVILERKLK